MQIVFPIAGLRRARLYNLAIALAVLSILAALGVYIVPMALRIGDKYNRYITLGNLAFLLLFGWITVSSVRQNGAYQIRRNKLRIRLNSWWISIPVKNLLTMRPLQPVELKGQLRIGGRLVWHRAFGMVDPIQAGPAFHEKLGPILMCAIKGEHCIGLRIRDDEHLLIVSPEDPDRFIDELRRRGVANG